MEPCPTPIRRDVWLKRKRDVDPGLERLRSQLRSTTNAAVPLGVWCAGGGCARARALRNKWVLNSILGDVASADVYVCLCIRMRMSIRTRMCMCMRLCRGGYYRFYQVFPVGPVWPHWRPWVGSLPMTAGLRCRPGVHPCIAPRPVRYALGPAPGSLPQDHPGSGVAAPWLLPGQLHGNSSTSPSSPCRPVCCVCIGVFTASGARGSEAASTAYSFGDFPRKDALDARLPPHASLYVYVKMHVYVHVYWHVCTPRGGGGGRGPLDAGQR